MPEANYSLVEKSNLKAIKEGLEILEDMKKKWDDPMKYQEELLMSIIHKNKDTEYGRNNNFDKIHSIDDYQKMVPVTTYDDYADYIMRMVENGEKNLITTSKINHYNKSSGTMGVPKKIPMSDEGMEQYNRYMKSLPFGVLSSKIGNDWIHGRTIRLAESTAEESFLPCGASFGAVSQKLTRQFRPYLPQLYTSPDEALFPEQGTDTRYLHALFALLDEDAVCILASFYSFILEELRYIEKNWKMLVDDIENGTVSDTVDMSDKVRASVSERLKPNPVRARELREVFERGFDEPFVPKVWKKMTYLKGIGTGGFKMYADMLRERYIGEDIHMVKMGIGSSEGFFSATYDINRDDAVLLPDATFLEFLPLDADDDFSKIVTIDGLVKDKEYELIITNVSGLYRYRMRDAVVVKNIYRNTPTVDFLYRIDKTISIMGEKTTEEALRQAACNTAQELGINMIDFSACPDLEYDPVRYQFFMEIDNSIKDMPPSLIRKVLEAKLGEVNPSMGDKIKKGICANIRVNFLQNETYQLYKDMMIMKGTASSQIKPVHVITNERQRSFFNSLTEYSTEVMR